MSRLFSWLFVAGWMMVIFYLSHQPAAESSHLSLSVTNWLLSGLSMVIPKEFIELEQLHFYIRKSAHFFAYFVLGVLLLRAFVISGVRGWKGAISAFLLSGVYAVSDEVHQLFVPGRGAQVSDVLIDSAGAFFGIVLWKSLGKLKKSFRK